MLYKYSPEVEERFKEIDQYINSDLKKSVEMYLKIAEDYADDEAVLAKAYYGAEDLVADADENLYVCKENGRNGIVLSK